MPPACGAAARIPAMSKIYLQLLTAGLALVLLSSARAQGTQFFVSPSGNDTATGSLAAPFQTVGRALSLAMPGDTVLLRAGTYRESVNAARSGAPGNPITIQNYNGEPAVLSALDVVPGPWTAQGGGTYAATVTGYRPVNFWTTLNPTSNGSVINESGGFMRLVAANESSLQTPFIRSQTASPAWDFFSGAVTWRVRGISAANTGTTPMPASNMNAYFSVMTGTGNGFGSDDSVTVYYRGDGRLILYLKKNTVNSWGTTAQTITDPAINGFDLTLGPASGGVVSYTFTAKRSSGADIVTTGSWTVSQAEWSDGGAGNTSYLGVLAQENVTATTDATQRFTISVDSFAVVKGAATVFRDEFDGGDLSTSNEFPSAYSSSISSGYDQVFVDGVMQDEARMPNRGSGTLMQPTTAALTVINSNSTINPNTISSATFGGQPDNFFAGARFVGGVSLRFAWQSALVASSSGTLLTVNPATRSTPWWPDHPFGAAESATGNGFVFGLLSLLDADGEWFLDQPTNLLSLRITGGADPAGRFVEIKRRNWCVNINGFDYITVRGVKTVGGAIRLNGTGNVLENVDASYLSHYLAWSSGYAPDGSRSEGGGVVVQGTGNTVRGCVIHDTAGSGVLVYGTGHLVTRNQLYNIDYSGTYGTGIQLFGNDHTATFNTITDTGRDGIRPEGGGLRVMFNDVSAFGRIAKDLAGIYTFGFGAISPLPGARTRIAYNWSHDRSNTTDTNSRGIYLDNGTRDYIVDHNVVWNVASTATGGSIILNSPAFGHELYHNTVIGAGTYNDSTFSNYSSPQSSNYNGLVFVDATAGLDFEGMNNIEVATTATASAFENFGTQDFTPKSNYNLTDERYGTGTIATVNPTASTGSVEWVKPSGTSSTNPYLSVGLYDPASPFFYREAYGHGQIIPGINAWVPDGKPDSGAYERGVARWIPGVNGWDGWKQDPLLSLGARTATLQGVRISIESSLSTSFRLYYGTTDGGTNAASWDAFVDLGTVVPGDVMSVFRNTLFGLTPGATYFARYSSSNVNGTTWSDPQSFTMAPSLTWGAGGGASTNISNNTNWTGSVYPDLTNGGEIATFASAGSTATIDTNVSLLGIIINRDANFTLANGAGALSVGAGGISVTLPSTTSRTHVISESNLTLSANQTWSISNNSTGTADLTINSAVGGAFGFTKTGTGNLRLGGNSSFDGSVNVNTGPIVVSNGNALGSAVGATTIAAAGNTTAGGQVSISGSIAIPENFIITGTSEAGSFTFPLNNSSGNNVLNGNITLVGTGGIRFGTGGGNLTLNGRIARSGTDSGILNLAASSGAVVTVNAPVSLNGGALGIINPGTVVLNAQSPDLGGTTIYFGSPAANGPTLRLGVNDALPTTRTLTLGTSGTSSGADRGTLDLNGYNQTVGTLIGLVGSGSASTTRRVTNSANGTLSTLTVGLGGGSSTFNGTIADGTGRVALVKVGTGTLTLTAANSYTGDTTVTGGVLTLATATLSSNSTVSLAGGSLNLTYTGTNNLATLRINGLVQAPGTWGAAASAATNKTSLITGAGLLNATGVQPPYDAWALANGLDNSSPAKDAALTADPDGDGVVNLLEYALGSNPASAASTAVPIASMQGGTRLEISFLRARGELNYLVEATSDLVTWTTIATNPGTVGQSVTVTDTVDIPAGSPRRFVRLRVSSP